MRTKEEILGNATGLTINDEVAYRIQTKTEYILQAMEEYHLEKKHEWYKKLLNKLRLINQGDELNLLDYIEEVKEKISATAVGCSPKGID